MLQGKRDTCILIMIVAFVGLAADAQISGVFPTLHCIDDVVDGPTACTISVFCTQPPNPIPGFVIGANAFKTCSNQPVENIALMLLLQVLKHPRRVNLQPCFISDSSNNRYESLIAQGIPRF